MSVDRKYENHETLDFQRNRSICGKSGHVKGDEEIGKFKESFVSYLNSMLGGIEDFAFLGCCFLADGDMLLDAILVKVSAAYGTCNAIRGRGAWQRTVLKRLRN